MTTRKYEHLMEPIQLGKELFRNRIFAAPQDYPGLTGDRFLTEEGCLFYERKALGGFASVCIGDFMVNCDKGGRSHPFQMRGDDYMNKANLTRASIGIGRHGAVPSIELNAAINIANPDLIVDYPGYVLGTYDYVREDGVEVRAMNNEQIEEWIQAFSDAASFAVQTGYRMLMLHGGHGWGIHQFISAHDNHRTDEWGGTLENRMRFPLAVIEAIRKRVGPSVPIEFRMSGTEFLEGGYDIDEGIRIAEMLDGKVDIIHVSVGCHENRRAVNYTHPTMFMDDGCNCHFAAEVKPHIKESKVATVGAFTDPDMMEEVIASGKADIIHLGRQSLADPDFPEKVMLEKADEIIPCQRCTTCFSYSTAGGVFYCAVNPEIGREEVAQQTNPPKNKKKVLVAGGGIGGMQAAITAAERGHEVILCEKQPELGGAINCEKDVSFKKNLFRYIDRQKVMLDREGVDVRLGTEVTPALVDEIKPDVLIASLGAKPRIPDIKGVDGKNVYCAEDLYRDLDKAGKKVAIIGGGLTGLELGVELARRKHDVTVIVRGAGTLATPPEPDPDAAPVTTSSKMGGLMNLPLGTEFVHGDGIGEEMLANLPNMKVALKTKTLEICDEGVKVCDKTGEHIIEADTVVYATGVVPLHDEARALRDCVKEFYQIGDCVVPESIYKATSVAYQTALDIGRW